MDWWFHSWRCCGFNRKVKICRCYRCYLLFGRYEKNRKGICVKVIVHPKNQTLLREVWFNYSTTIGLREKKINRWILPRRIVCHETKFGKVNVKQVIRPNGQVSIKIEHKNLTQISFNTGIPIEEIRQKLFIELSEVYELDGFSFWFLI